MASRLSFSGDQLALAEIAAHHRDLESSLRLYFSLGSASHQARFVGYTAAELANELGQRLDEADLSSCLTVLASLEAAFRIDYLQRCYKRGKDAVSRAFRDIYKHKGQHVSLEDEIFHIWASHASGARPIIGDLRSVFRFRHWLAHGRYWTPKLGRRYEFDDVFAIADLTMQSFPFYEFLN